MTRDEVLDEALKAIEPEVNWCGCTGALRALKSEPVVSECVADYLVPRNVTTTIDLLVDERDALKLQAGEPAWQRTEVNLRADQWEVEAKSLRAQVAQAQAQAAVVRAHIERLAARLRWLADVAPQTGETP